MKRIHIFIVLTIFLMSCGSKDVLVEGTLMNSSDETVYLDELTSIALDPVDSVVVDADGHFAFKGEIYEPTFFVLHTTVDNFITLIIHPDESITVTADVADLSDTYSVEGSKDSKLVMELNSDLKKTISEINKINKIYNESKKNKGLDTIKKRLNYQYIELVTNHKKKVIRFIEDNTESLACLLALYQEMGKGVTLFNPNDDMKYFKMVSEILSEVYPDLDQVIMLDDYIDDIERQIGAVDYDIETDTISIGEVAPEIMLPDPKGKNIALSSFKGKYVLLHFWASWSKSSKVENPYLFENYKKYNKKGFEIYQISLDKSKDDWMNALEADSLKWTNVSDLKHWNCAAVDFYKVDELPYNFLIDKEGKVIAKNLRGNDIDTFLEETFKKKSKKKKKR